jgi:hypothetical protein
MNVNPWRQLSPFGQSIWLHVIHHTDFEGTRSTLRKTFRSRVRNG